MIRFHLPDNEEIEFPHVDDVHWLHDNVALLEGGRTGILNEGGLISALSRPQNFLYYSDENPDLLDLAGYLWHGISEAHAYVDANKRTAVLTAISFLEANGIEYIADSSEVGKLVTRWYVADSFQYPILVSYLRARCRWS